MALSEQFLPAIQKKFTGGVMPVGVCQNWTQPYGEGAEYQYPNYAQWAAGTRSITLALPTAAASEVPFATNAVVTSVGADGAAPATGAASTASSAAATSSVASSAASSSATQAAASSGVSSSSSSSARTALAAQTTAGAVQSSAAATVGNGATTSGARGMGMTAGVVVAALAGVAGVMVVLA